MQTHRVIARRQWLLRGGANGNNLYGNVKRPAECITVFFKEQGQDFTGRGGNHALPAGHRHGQAVFLSDKTDIERDFLAHGQAAGYLPVLLFSHVGKQFTGHLVGFLDAALIKLQQARSCPRAGGVCAQQSPGRESAGVRRHHNRGDFQVQRQQTRPQRSGAAIAHQGQPGGVNPAFHGNFTHRVRHRRGGNSHHSLGGLVNGNAQFIGKVLQGPGREIAIQGQSRFKFPGAEHAQVERRVRGGCPGSAAAVTGGAGNSAGAFRPHSQQTMVVITDGTAAGADGADVHPRHLQGHAHYLTLVQQFGATTHYQAGIETGAAHVGAHNAV